jgi:arginine dihydrolase
MQTRVLFCDPTHFDVIDAKNPFMRPGAALDRLLARKQWDSVKAAFAAAGYSAVVLPSAPGLEDMVFANNQVFVGGSARGEKFIVPSRMRYESRRREVPHYVAWFRERGYRVIDLDFGDDFLEGHGDLLWNGNRLDPPKKPLVWAGYGIRSTRGGVEKFSRALAPLGIEVVLLELRDPRFYHLDTCFAPLTENAVIVYPEAFTAESFQRIQQRVPRVYVIGEPDALKFICNGVAVGGRFIAPATSPQLLTALRREKLEPVLVDTSEFQKSGGSVCCLKLFWWE